MILSQREHGLCLVEQVEHGRIAGVLAAQWGNDRFDTPRPRESVIVAASLHDEGWRARDLQPVLNEVARRPEHFLEIEPDAHVRLYSEGVEKVRLGDVYAGLLVGMHWTGLYRGRWSGPHARGRLARDAADERRLDEAVLQEEHRWVEERRRAWQEDEPRAAFEQNLWHTYELLQLWDLLSLYLCVMPHEPGDRSGLRQPWGPQLTSLTHEPEAVTLPSVRTGAYGPRVTIAAFVDSQSTVTVDPWPFVAPSFTVEIEQRVLPDLPLERSVPWEAVAGARTEALSWTITSPACTREYTHA